MLRASIPVDEGRRLTALRQLRLVDQPEDPGIARLVDLAVELFGTPIAAASLIDIGRQWACAERGLGTRSIPRDISLCGHALLQERPLVIEDARSDPRFADNPLVQGPPHIRGYLGQSVWVQVPSGRHAVGTMAIMDPRPRRFTPREIELLGQLASAFEGVLAARLQTFDLERIEQLSRVSLSAQSTFIDAPDEDLAFDELLSGALALTGCQAGAVLLWQPDLVSQHRLSPRACRGIGWTEPGRLATLANGVAWPVAELNMLLAKLGPALSESRLSVPSAPPLMQLAECSAVLLPLRTLGRPAGALLLVDRRSPMRVDPASLLAPLLPVLAQLLLARRERESSGQVQRTLKRLSRVASETTNGVVITDRLGQTDWVNRAFERISGYALDEIRGQSPGKVLQGPESDRATVARMSAALARGEGFDEEIINYTRQGKPFWLHINCSPLLAENGSLEGFIAIETDITDRKLQALALSRSEARFRGLSDSAPVGIFETDAEGRCVYVNRRWSELAGLSAEQAMGDGWARALHPDDREAVFAEWARSARAGTPFAMDYRFITPFGEVRWLNGRAMPLGSGGPSEGFIGTITDITESRTAEQRLRQAYDLLERSSEAARIGTWEVDLERNIANWSAMTKRIHEVPEDFECEVDRAIEFYTDDWSRELVSESFSRLVADGTPFDIELTLRTARGNVRWVRSIGLAEFDSGRCIRAYGLFQDIDEIKRLERMKQEFVSTVSHELRTPLTSISGSLSVLSSGAVSADSPTARQLLEVGHRNATRLIKLVSDLLDLDKLVAGKMQLDIEASSLTRVVTEAMDALVALAEQKRIRLRRDWPDDLPPALIDSFRTQQVVTNLVGNAIKFSPDDSEVVVRVRPAGQALRLEVIDQGPGIPEEFRSQIFESFAQASGPAASGKGGTGLGLAISRELMARMGGRIGFESEAGQGTTFWAEFPLAGAA
ncbi:PAS domain S-box protein [Pseudomarimonas salicorniae]|uniref:histidine kinase n=1 Tax=Pseudomarimonas salicorniae TaxID=2933270 RepID=A0ABT0GGA6_9GAMM|nr:PAS domain S-box protein [Lysobacter sp. CAU 1642]MCK7593566.1 PAS domain S-box protein [Lysobacter sp. CAU 1642]